MNNKIIKAIVLSFLFGGVSAQSPLLPYHPTNDEIADRYSQMVLMDSITKNTVFKTTVIANWQKNSKRFWYRNVLKDSVMEYIVVDAATGIKNPLFDAVRLAEALNKISNLNLNPQKLRINELSLLDKNQISFRLQKQCWQCNLTNYSCKEIDSIQFNPNTALADRFKPYSHWDYHEIKGDSLSPDKQWIAYIKDYNVYLKPVGGGEEIAFTSDGTEANPYGELLWSPDSRYFIGYKIDQKKEKEVYYILTSAPNTTRGQLKSQPYAQPGDEFTSYEMFVFDMESKKPIKVSTDKYDFLGMPYPVWNKNPRYFSFEKTDRGHQRFRIIEVDAANGNTRNIVDEQTHTFIYESRIFTHYLTNTNEIIWVSEKDGWRHLYLVDGAKGLTKPITKGEWVVRNIDSVDEKKRQIWFSASGMYPNEDPYNIHFYRIGFDGKGLVHLTTAKGNHQLSFSPDRTYYIDTYSQPAVAPVTELHWTSDGKLIAQLEQADISNYLATGVRLPEVFVAKGRDGKTDIWGVVCRPGKMDSTKRYPVIENIYAGPQDSFVPKNFMSYGEMQSLAELGFIVVQCDGMGTANRSKTFHDVCWKNLADAGFPDRIAWIKALAVKYSYVDTTRVGLYGTSAGGQNALGGLLFHSGFYKAAVAACGCHDNRVDKQWWNEQWMGYPVDKCYEEQSNVTNAYKLQGKLLLIVGEADTNVPPESTYRVADALIKANKMFEFLPIPGMGHSDGGAYGRKKKRDFFVKTLLGIDPPDRNINEVAGK